MYICARQRGVLAVIAAFTGYGHYPISVNILHIISSPRKGASASIQLATGIIEKLQAAHPGSNVAVYDLATNPFPLL
jgi:hypothetical protein